MFVFIQTNKHDWKKTKKKWQDTMTTTTKTNDDDWKIYFLSIQPASQTGEIETKKSRQNIQPKKCLFLLCFFFFFFFLNANFVLCFFFRWFSFTDDDDDGFTMCISSSTSTSYTHRLQNHYTIDLIWFDCHHHHCFFSFWNDEILFLSLVFFCFSKRRLVSFWRKTIDKKYFQWKKPENQKEWLKRKLNFSSFFFRFGWLVDCTKYCSGYFHVRCFFLVSFLIIEKIHHQIHHDHDYHHDLFDGHDSWSSSSSSLSFSSSSVDDIVIIFFFLF